MKKIPEFRIGFSFFAVAAFLLSGELYRNYIITVVLSFLHEAGHLAAMLAFGVLPQRISLEIHGIRIDKPEASLTYFQECAVALAGPLVNAVMMLIFMNQPTALPFIMNAGLLVVNLLPVKSLDGGRFLYYLISMLGSEQKAENALKILSIITALALAAILVFMLVSGFKNPSVLIFAVIMIVSVTSELFR